MNLNALFCLEIRRNHYDQLQVAQDSKKSKNKTANNASTADPALSAQLNDLCKAIIRVEVCAFVLYFKARTASFDESAATFRTHRISPLAKLTDTKGT